MKNTQVLASGATFRFLGITDEITDCGCCGRAGLKRTVGLKNKETGETHYFGTDCASKALRWGRKFGPGRGGQYCNASSFKGISAGNEFVAITISPSVRELLAA